MPGSYDHSPADVIRKLLRDLNLATATDGVWPVVHSNEPSNPDRMVTVYSVTGTKDGRTMVDGEVQGRAGIQVRVRAESPKEAERKINSIASAFDSQVLRTAVTMEDATEYVVQSVSREGDPIPIGRETPTSQRHVYTLNASVSLRQTS